MSSLDNFDQMLASLKQINMTLVCDQNLITLSVIKVVLNSFTSKINKNVAKGSNHEKVIYKNQAYHRKPYSNNPVDTRRPFNVYNTSIHCCYRIDLIKMTLCVYWEIPTVRL